MTKLTRYEWIILDSLADDTEPFEVVDGAIKNIDSSVLPYKTLEFLFDLYKKDFIKIRQLPLNQLGQEFNEKEIIPKNPLDVLGDISNNFEEYCKLRKYLWNYNIGGEETGIPFGIWIVMTDRGRKEWNKDKYKEYYEK